MPEEYEIQLKYITRQFVEADSPEEARESISEEVNTEELDLFQIDIIDEEGHVVDQEARE
jgi:hypothetical protein